MTKKELLSAENAQIETQGVVHVAVMQVQKCNFNDTYYLHTEDIDLSTLGGKPLQWFDPYFGRGSTTSVQIAIVAATKNRLYVLEKDGKEIRLHEREPAMDLIFTRPLDEKLFLASHLYMVPKKTSKV